MIAKMIFCGFVFLWGFALVADGASADEVILVNGDKMTGTVVKVEGGKLTIKTEYADAVEIQAEKIHNGSGQGAYSPPVYGDGA